MAAAPVVPKEPIVEGLPPEVNKDDEEKRRLQASLQSKDEELKRWKDLANRRPNPAPPAPPTGAPVTAEQLKVEFFKDPVNNSIAIARMAAAEAASSVQASSFETLMTLARKEARDEDPELFDKYSVEIDSLVQTTTENSPQLRTNASVWKNGALQIYGRHRREISGQPPAKGNGEAPAVHIPGDGPAPPSARRAPAPKQAPLTDDDKAFMKGFRLTEDQYRNGIKLKENEGDGLPDSPSSWDPVVTVDSVKQGRVDWNPGRLKKEGKLRETLEKGAA